MSKLSTIHCQYSELHLYDLIYVCGAHTLLSLIHWAHDGCVTFQYHQEAYLDYNSHKMSCHLRRYFQGTHTHTHFKIKSLFSKP